MKKKFYAVGETFKDEESGKTLKVVRDGVCYTCFYVLYCQSTPECRKRFRPDQLDVSFKEVKPND